jgi:hypothetical protein
MTENHPKTTKKPLFSVFFGFWPPFIGIWSKVTEVWVGVGGPRADFASLLLIFGHRAAAGPAEMTRNDVQNDRKSSKNHEKSCFFAFFRVLTAVCRHLEHGSRGLGGSWWSWGRFCLTFGGFWRPQAASGTENEGQRCAAVAGACLHAPTATAARCQRGWDVGQT